MSEINRIMEQINRQCEQAHIILGAAIDEELGDSISVTLLASSPAKPLPAPARPTDATATMADEQAISAAISTEPSNRPIVVSAPPRELTKQPSPEVLTSGGRQRKGSPRMRQGQLPLDMVAKGRFEKSEPTIHNGHDLDVPTYIRRGIALN